MTANQQQNLAALLGLPTTAARPTIEAALMRRAADVRAGRAQPIGARRSPAPSTGRERVDRVVASIRDRGIGSTGTAFGNPRGAPAQARRSPAPRVHAARSGARPVDPVIASLDARRDPATTTVFGQRMAPARTAVRASLGMPVAPTTEGVRWRCVLGGWVPEFEKPGTVIHR